MNLSQIIILASGVIAISAFTVYTFGDSLSLGAPKAKSGDRVQPVQTTSASPSLTVTSNPNTSSNAGINANNKNNFTAAKSNSTKNPLPSSTSSFNVYENRDMPQDYYTIKFPSDFNVVHGNKPGIYDAKLADGTSFYLVNLVEIPDTTNTQLYVLTQEIPHLKSTLQDFKKISITEGNLQKNNNNNGYAVWNLIYTWKNSTQQMESIESFVEGSDRSAIISFSAPVQQFERNNSTISSVIGSFQWIQ